MTTKISPKKMRDEFDQPRQILIVDDLEDNRKLLHAIFRAEGVTVTCVGSVRSAREELLSEKSFDLVLSDISMPEESGFELLEWMRGQPERIRIVPVLFITSDLPQDNHRIHGLMLGAVDYVVRPISHKELVLRAQNAIDHFRRFQSLKDSLESSEDMAMTGRILAAANHEIRNLTGLILLTSDRALNMVNNGEQVTPGSMGYHAMQALHKTSKLLADVSRNLNTHVHNDPINVESLSIRSVVSEVMEVVRPRLHQVIIDVRNDVGEGYALADATKLKQILINFIFNAHDAILERGHLDGVGRILVHISETESGDLSVIVGDNGIGLPKGETRVDFEPFRTTKSVRGGKGLGLWLCSRFAQAMGGSIALKSTGPGHGATSQIFLKRGQPAKDFSVEIENYFVD